MPKHKSRKSASKRTIKTDYRKELVIRDLGENMLAEFLSRKIIDFDVERKYYGARLFEDASEGNSIEHINNSGEQVHFLMSYLTHTEEAFEHLLNEHAVYDLLYWFRRMPPSNYFGHGQELSIRLWHKIITNAIFKYGRYSSVCDEERCKILFGGGLHPDSVCEAYLRGGSITKTITNTLKAIFRTLVVGHFYLLCTQDYRVFNKGGMLESIDNDYKYEVNQSPELQHLVNLYDSNPHPLLAISGFNTDNIDINPKNLFKLIGCVLNPDNKLKLPSSYFKKIGLDTSKFQTQYISKRLN